MAGRLEIDPASFDDTELGGFCRDALVAGKTITNINVEACERHDVPDECCPTCGLEAPLPEGGARVVLQVHTGDEDLDRWALRGAAQSVANALSSTMTGVRDAS